VGINASTSTRTKGFTLLELLIVLALMGGVYALLLPSLSKRTGSDIANILGRLGQDVRGVFDTAILTNMPHRIVFNLFTGDYWVEVADDPKAMLSAGHGGVDSPAVEQEKREKFQTDFEKYQDLVGQPIKDASGDEEIIPTSPVLQAKAQLEGANWSKLKGIEWGMRSFGKDIGIRSMQCEHHERKISVEEDGKDAYGYLYIFPGYVEKAVLYLYYRQGEFTFDQTQPPFTILTKPYEGGLDIRTGYTEVDIRAEDASTWGL